MSPAAIQEVAALTLAEVRALRAEIARIEAKADAAYGAARAAVEPPPRILSREQAMRFANIEAASTFYAWCIRFGITPCSHGRYSLNSISRALLREEQSK